MADINSKLLSMGFDTFLSSYSVAFSIGLVLRKPAQGIDFEALPNQFAQLDYAGSISSVFDP